MTIPLHEGEEEMDRSRSSPASALHGRATDTGVKLEGCGCYRCLEGVTDPATGWPVVAMRMILCPTCRNKRCPHSTDHRLACTGNSGPPSSIQGPPMKDLTLADELERVADPRNGSTALGLFVWDNLPAILSALRGEQWQGIETAPKSTATQTPHGLMVHGIYLLGFCPEEGADPNGCIEVIWWEPGENNGRGAWFCNGYECRPTHWRPLPPPPKGQADE